jgi:hypothetical protein
MIEIRSARAVAFGVPKKRSASIKAVRRHIAQAQACGLKFDVLMVLFWIRVHA